jgi:uncharacterized protein YjbI with pentapeptide repeats
MTQSPNKYRRCNKDEALELFESFPPKAKKSIPGIALKSIIDLLGDDEVAPLHEALETLFPGEPLEKARRRLTTEIANRVYKDEADVAPLQIESTRKGVEPARIWIERIEQGDARGLTEAGERYAVETYVPAEAVQQTSAEIANDILNERAGLVKANSEIDQTTPPPEIPTREAPSELDHTTTKPSGNEPRNPSFTLSRNKAIENVVNPNSAVNDSLRGIDNKHFTQTKGELHEGLGGLSESAFARRGKTVNALDAMLDWVSDSRENAPRLLALLGDYGTGKTSHALQFSRIINGEVDHAKRPKRLLTALHIDLAYLRGAPSLAQLNVTQIIEIVIDARGLKHVLSASDAIREVREGRRVVVYDGLDELMQTDHSQLNSVFRQLLQIFEPDPMTRTPSRARAIVSCRTHYFRDVAEQHQFFDTRSRGSVSSKDYVCLYLLPWTKDTVRKYLSKRLSADEAKALEETIRTTYNLEELASRPVLLAMMCEQVNAILRLRDENGGTITASTLYAQTVAMWVHRDNGKHIIQQRHKPILMGALACAMWNDGKEQWDADQLDQWLRKTVDLLFPGHYSPEQTRAIQDDLRTATFIVRDSKRSDGFAFAHRSFEEYFLAQHVVRILEASRDEIELSHQQLPNIELTQQTVSFLSEIWIKRAEFQYLRTRTTWRLLSWGTSNELKSTETDYPGACPLSHGVLFQIALALGLEGSSVDNRINLRGTFFAYERWNGLKFPKLDFRGASFDACHIENVDLQDAWFSHGHFVSSTIKNCRLDGTFWRGATRFDLHVRQNDLSGRKLHLNQNRWSRPPWRAASIEVSDSLSRLCRTRNPMLVDAVRFDGDAKTISVDAERRTYVFKLATYKRSVRLVRVRQNFGVRFKFTPVKQTDVPSIEIKWSGSVVRIDFVQLDTHKSYVVFIVVTDRPSFACFDAEGRLVDYDEEAADTWLRYLGNGYPQPVEAAWCELDEFGRALGPKKAALEG